MSTNCTVLEKVAKKVEAFVIQKVSVEDLTAPNNTVPNGIWLHISLDDQQQYVTIEKTKNLPVTDVVFQPSTCTSLDAE
jgi:hypothetical protein